MIAILRIFPALLILPTLEDVHHIQMMFANTVMIVIRVSVRIRVLSGHAPFIPKGGYEGRGHEGSARIEGLASRAFDPMARRYCHDRAPN